MGNWCHVTKLLIIIPLASLFHISRMSFLGNNTTDHFEKLNMLWLRALRLGVKISETALKEYLHDQTFLLRVSSDEYFCADETTDETQKWELLERSVKGYLYCAVSDKL